MIKDYILWNWALLLVLAAFAVSLKETVFLDKHTIRRFYILIVMIFLLSIVVYAEFYLTDLGKSREIRTVLMAIRYSATPFILALVIYTLIRELRWFIFIPAIFLGVINFLSIFNGIVFRVDEDHSFHRGPLGYLPFVMVGLYCTFLIYILVKRSNRQMLEIFPIAFLGLSFASGLVLPFVYGRDYSKIFCSTIAIALYVYYVFLILQLTKIDALTGLLNRQAYYADIEKTPENIKAVVSIDMNGLKAINDNGGHEAGDKALVTLATCILRARKRRQLCYRLGGDEFVIICRQTSKEEALQLVENIKKRVAETKYSCSIGYSHSGNGTVSVNDLLRESDEMMYAEKARYYMDSRKDRRLR